MIDQIEGEGDPLDGLVLLSSPRDTHFYVGMGAEGRAFVLLYEPVELDSVDDLDESWWSPYRTKMKESMQKVIDLLSKAKRIGETTIEPDPDMRCAVWMRAEVAGSESSLLRMYNRSQVTDELMLVLHQVDGMLEPYFAQNAAVEKMTRGEAVDWDS